MSFVKVGIIGVGSMGASHFNAIKDLSNAKITAICDINPKVLEKYKEDKEVECFPDSDSFFAKADVDAVIVATPHFFHHTLAVEALSKGKHVLVEKPIAVHKKFAQVMVNAAKKYPKLKFSAMFNQRTLEAHKKIKYLIDSGEIGDITRINWIITDWFRTQTYYDSGDWRASWRGEGGGVLLNQCPHQLDLMQWFFGMPKSITAFGAFGKYHDIEVEDEVTAYLEYENGATGIFISSTGEFPGTNRLEITADRGKIVYEGGKISFTRTEESVKKFRNETLERFDGPETWNVDVPYKKDDKPQHTNILINFFDAILKDVELLAPAVEGINGLEIGNAMLLSMLKNNKKIEIPMNAEEIATELDKLIANSRYEKRVVDVDLSSGLEGSF